MRCANIIGNAVHDFGLGCVCIRWFEERKKDGLVRTCFLSIRCHFKYVSVCFWIHSSVNACIMFSERLIPLKLIYWINSSDCGNGTVHSLWITTDFIRFDCRIFATKCLQQIIVIHFMMPMKTAQQVRIKRASFARIICPKLIRQFLFNDGINRKNTDFVYEGVISRKSMFRLERINGTGYCRPRSVANPHLKPQNQCKNLQFRFFSFIYFWLESSLLK